MAITAQQRERIKNALFYANQNPDEAVDAIVEIIEGSGGGSVNKMPTQADSVAEDIATLKNDFNSLLTKLKTAGLMA